MEMRMNILYFTENSDVQENIALNRSLSREIKKATYEAGFDGIIETFIHPQIALINIDDIDLVILAGDYVKRTSICENLNRLIWQTEHMFKSKILYYIQDVSEINISLSDLSHGTIIEASDDIEKDAIRIAEALREIKYEALTETLKRMQVKEEIDNTYVEHIEPILKNLKDKEDGDKKKSYFCYTVSGTCLLLAVVVAFFFLNQAGSNEVSEVLIQSIRVISIITIILTLARMMFALGKNFMVESIRNGDRHHAISFGKFFIDVFGADITKDEMMRILDNWNMNTGSSFINQKSSDIDPQAVNKAISILEKSKMIK